jgi:hypothetical protein
MREKIGTISIIRAKVGNTFNNEGGNTAVKIGAKEGQKIHFH